MSSDNILDGLKPGGGGTVAIAVKETEEALKKVKDLEFAHISRASVRAGDSLGETIMTENKNPETQSSENSNGGSAAAEESGTIFSHETPGPEKRTVANMLGEVTWLLTQSQRHKNFFLSDLEWLVMTPILLQQFRVFYAKDRPIGVVLWAKVDEEVEGRLSTGNAKLRPQDWKSGDKLWVVDVIAPFGGIDEMLKDLKEKVFPTEEFKFLAAEDGKPVVKEM